MPHGPPFQSEAGSGNKRRISGRASDGTRHTVAQFPAAFSRANAALIWTLLHNLPQIIEAVEAQESTVGQPPDKTD